jgi:hypothetical protein
MHTAIPEILHNLREWSSPHFLKQRRKRKDEYVGWNRKQQPLISDQGVTIE